MFLFMPVLKYRSRAYKAKKGFKVELLKYCQLKIETPTNNDDTDTSNADETSFDENSDVNFTEVSITPVKVSENGEYSKSREKKISDNFPMPIEGPITKYCKKYFAAEMRSLPNINKKNKFSSIGDRACVVTLRSNNSTKRTNIVPTELGAEIPFLGKYQLPDSNPFYCYEVDDPNDHPDEVVFVSSDEKYVGVSMEKAVAASVVIRNIVSTAEDTIPPVCVPIDTQTLIQLGSWIYCFSVKEHMAEYVSPTINRMEVTSCETRLLPTDECELLKLADAASFMEILKLFDACVEKLAEKMMHREMPPRDIYKFWKTYSSRTETFVFLVYRKIVLESIAIVKRKHPYPVSHRRKETMV